MPADQKNLFIEQKWVSCFPVFHCFSVDPTFSSRPRPSFDSTAKKEEKSKQAQTRRHLTKMDKNVLEMILISFRVVSVFYLLFLSCFHFVYNLSLKATRINSENQSIYQYKSM
jgi:hypothetical protein